MGRNNIDRPVTSSLKKRGFKRWKIIHLQLLFSNNELSMDGWLWERNIKGNDGISKQYHIIYFKSIFTHEKNNMNYCRCNLHLQDLGEVYAKVWKPTATDDPCHENELMWTNRLMIQMNPMKLLGKVAARNTICYYTAPNFKNLYQFVFSE